MNVSAERDRSEVQVLAAFLLPQYLLDRATSADTPEALIAKARRNKTWLLRWLPRYLKRWGLIFGGFWLLEWFGTFLGLPRPMTWAIEFAAYASLGIMTWLGMLYVQCLHS